MDTEKDLVLCGVKIGEHSFDVDGIEEEIRERAIKRGCNLVYMRPQDPEGIPSEAYVKWARFLAAHKIYFHFGYKAQQKLWNRESQFDQETTEKIRQAAGKYFLGNATSEPGTATACNFAGYYRPPGFRTVQKTDCTDMKQAHDNYVGNVKTFADDNRELNMPNILCIEATALSKYDMEAGVNIPILEVMNGNPDELIPSVRGAARAYGSTMWGTLIAHEWYGGMRHSDILKRKRLELAWKYCYLAGANTIMLESGDEGVDSYGERHGVDSSVCEDYRSVIAAMADYAKMDARPAGGPKVTVGFVSGRYDPWGGFCGSSAWNQFLREEWGYGEAEHSWRLLDELGTKRKWADVANYGTCDMSAYPAYGMYDIVPVESDVEALCRYSCLIFTGWNSMTDEDMDKLTEFVRRGGKLLMTAAHLNYNTARNTNVMLPPQEKVEKLFGCRFTGKTCRTNSGTKFGRGSLNGEHLYPGSESYYCDPLYSAGYMEYAQTELLTARPLGTLSDSFWGIPEDGVCSVIENRVGAGTATLVTGLHYPGHPALYPLYRTLVREFISASARSCEVKVVGSDRLRYAVYEGGKMYLLNTDYDLPITVKVTHAGTEQTVTLESLELKTLQI